MATDDCLQAISVTSCLTDNVAFCTALAFATHEIPFGTSITNTYHQVLAQAERLLSSHLHRHPIGKQSDLRQLDSLALLQGVVHGGGIHRFDPDDANVRPQPFDVRGNAGDESAAANGYEDGVDRSTVLPQDFHANGALSGNHRRIVIRMHKRALFLRHQLGSVFLCLTVGIAV
jgi:hypothetical protein